MKKSLYADTLPSAEIYVQRNLLHLYCIETGFMTNLLAGTRLPGSLSFVIGFCLLFHPLICIIVLDLPVKGIVCLAYNDLLSFALMWSFSA